MHLAELLMDSGWLDKVDGSYYFGLTPVGEYHFIPIGVPMKS